MTGTSSYAVTVLGHDRPGIIAETTERLSGLGLNIEDSTMTLLRGHFAMTLISAGDATAPDIETALAPLTADGSLSVVVRTVSHEEPLERAGSPWVLSVHGGDRPRIVSSILAEVARAGGNVTDLSTRLAGELYLLIAEIDLPPGVDADAVAGSIGRVAASIGVGASLRPMEADDL